MLNSRFFSLSLLLLTPLLFFLNCTSDNSTDLGAGVIRDKFPNEYRAYSMDTQEVYGSIALPQLPTDTGFGIHQVGGIGVVGTETMMIGDSLGEHSGGFARISIPRDSNHFFGNASDTLTSLSIIVRRDTIRNAPRSLQVWQSSNTFQALQASPGNLLGTLNLRQKDTVGEIDSLSLPLTSFADSIFQKCTTSVIDTLHPHRDTLCLSFTNIITNTSDSLARIHGDPRLVIGYKKPNDTNHYFVSYGVNGNFGWDSSKTYYVAQRSASATDSLPLSYASKRTLVYKFSARNLWDSINAFPDWNRTQVISASFSLRRPDALFKDSLMIQYLFSDKLIRSGIRLDTLFAKNQDPGTALLVDTATNRADVGASLQSLKYSNRSLDTLYLYLRLAEDKWQIWKKASFKLVPLLKATIAAH